jgi:hypothetical protein
MKMRIETFIEILLKTIASLAKDASKGYSEKGKEVSTLTGFLLSAASRMIDGEWVKNQLQNPIYKEKIEMFQMLGIVDVDCDHVYLTPLIKGLNGAIQDGQKIAVKEILPFMNIVLHPEDLQVIVNNLQKHLA